MEGKNERDPILDNAIDKMEQEDTGETMEPGSPLPPKSAEDAAGIVDSELPDDILVDDEDGDGTSEDSGEQKELEGEEQEVDDLSRLEGEPLSENESGSDVDGDVDDDIDAMLDVDDNDDTSSEQENNPDLPEAKDTEVSDDFMDDLLDGQSESESEVEGDSGDDFDDIFLDGGNDINPEEKQMDDLDEEGESDTADVNNLLPEDDEDDDPIDDWSKDFEDDEDDTDFLSDSEEDEIDDIDEIREDEGSVDDEVVKNVFEESGHNNEGQDGMPAETDSDDFAEMLNTIDSMDDRVETSEQAEGVDSADGSEDIKSKESDVDYSQKQKVASEDDGNSKKEDIDTKQHQNESEPGKSKKSIIKTVVLGSFFAGLIVSAVVLFKNDHFSMPSLNEESSSVVDEKISALEKRISQLQETVNSSSGDRKERFSEILSRYDEMVKTQELLSSEQERYSSLVKTLRSDLESYEDAMLERFKKVIDFASSVSEKQTQQAQTIKDTVLREALAIMKKQESDPNGQKLSALQSELRESEKKMAQLEATVLAQRQMFSLIEDEMGYLKERVNRTVKESSETPVPTSKTEERNSLIDPSEGGDKEARVTVEPDYPESSGNIFSSQEEKIKPEKFEYPQLSLVGVHAKANGAFDIYTQPKGSVTGEGIEPYWFSPNQSSSIPGYGRILSVKELDNSSRRVPYVVITENGEIRGKK